MSKQAVRESALIRKIRSLPPEKVAEVKKRPAVIVSSAQCQAQRRDLVIHGNHQPDPPSPRIR